MPAAYPVTAYTALVHYVFVMCKKNFNARPLNAFSIGMYMWADFKISFVSILLPYMVLKPGRSLSVDKVHPVFSTVSTCYITDSGQVDCI